MVRKKLEIDEDIIYKMATLHCTQKEMAEKFECTAETIRERFSSIIYRGNADGKEELRALQWKAAKKGNVEMLKWLGREILGQGKPQNFDLDTQPIDRLMESIENERNRNS